MTGPSSPTRSSRIQETEELLEECLREGQTDPNLPPLPGGQDGTLFLCEKPGLDVAHIEGQDEILTDE